MLLSNYVNIFHFCEEEKYKMVTELEMQYVYLYTFLTVFLCGLFRRAIMFFLEGRVDPVVNFGQFFKSSKRSSYSHYGRR